MNVYPVRVSTRPDAPSRWLWLVKWLLLIPHYLVLAVLWFVFVVLTVVAYVAVLFTGRYPRGMFEFNVGVLRWSWRVGYYGYRVLGTDRYPPFTLSDVPDYPARLEIDGPPVLPRWRPLVGWLLALPHLILISLLTSGVTWTVETHPGALRYTSPSLVGFVVLIAAVVLLVRGAYLRELYNLLVGVWRWWVRVVAYVALLVEPYPPFRLDQGPDEPSDGPAGTSTAAPLAGVHGSI